MSQQKKTLESMISFQPGFDQFQSHLLLSTFCFCLILWLIHLHDSCCFVSLISTSFLYVVQCLPHYPFLVRIVCLLFLLLFVSVVCIVVVVVVVVVVVLVVVGVVVVVGCALQGCHGQLSRGPHTNDLIVVVMILVRKKTTTKTTIK